MKHTYKFLSLLFFILFLLQTSSVFAQLSIDLETGFFKVNQNDASSSWQNSQGVLNGIDGTTFSYADQFDNPNRPLFRLRASYSFGKTKSHFLSALAAPLQYKSNGIFTSDVIFNSKTFLANTATEGFYKFSGYRLTYRYMIQNTERLKLGIGLTVNFRDAEFSLQQGEYYERNYNRGFVPLVNTYLNYQFSPKFGLLIDGDVFYIDKTGGAIDYLSGLSYKASPHLSFKSGYRFFSGVGSEKGNVFNKLFVSSAVIGVVYTW